MCLLYILKRDADHNEYNAMLIRAKSVKQARMIANSNCGDEGEIWCDEGKVSCKVVERKGNPEIVIESYNSA